MTHTAYNSTKIGVILPYSLSGAVMYVWMKWFFPAPANENVFFLHTSPRSFRSEEDMLNANAAFRAALGDYPDYVLIINMHLDHIVADLDVYNKLRVKKRVLGFDYIDYEWDYRWTDEEGKSYSPTFTAYPSMMEKNWDTNLHQMFLTFTNLIRPKEERIGSFSVNDNRKELIRVAKGYEENLTNLTQIPLLNAILWAMNIEMHANTHKYMIRFDAKPAMCGFEVNFKEGPANRAVRGLAEYANKSSAKSVLCIKESRRFRSIINDRTYGLMFIEQEGIDYLKVAWELLNDYEVVILVNSKVAYYYTRWNSTITVDELSKEFQIISKSPRQGIILNNELFERTVTNRFCAA